MQVIRGVTYRQSVKTLPSRNGVGGRNSVGEGQITAVPFVLSFSVFTYVGMCVCIVCLRSISFCKEQKHPKLHVCTWAIWCYT